jgi:hypothetical protein
MSKLPWADPQRPESSVSGLGNDQVGVTPTAATDKPLTSRLFPTVYLGSFLAVLLFAIVINILGNGTNLLPSPGFPSDSDRAWKARRLEALVRSGSPPQAIILGSSRVTGFEPQYIERITGRPCFNCGVSVGCPVDYLAQFRFLLSLGTKPQLLIIGVDELAFGDHRENDAYDMQLVTHPGLFRQVPLPEKLSIVGRALKTITVQSTRKSLANLKSKVLDSGPEDEDTSANYFADGLSRHFLGNDGPARRERLAAGIDEKVKFWSASLDQSWKIERMRPQAPKVRYFKELLALAHEHGVQVFVALLPVQPEYERRVFTPRLYEIRQELNTLLRDTCRAFGDEYQDLSSLESFGGDAEDFIDGTHPTTKNTRRMIDVLLRRRSHPAAS